MEHEKIYIYLGIYIYIFNNVPKTASASCLVTTDISFAKDLKTTTSVTAMARTFAATSVRNAEESLSDFGGLL